VDAVSEVPDLALGELVAQVFQQMSIGRFYGGVAALIWVPEDNRYLLLKRSDDKDFAAGVWECVTGRLDQGEGFEDAVRREVREELGTEIDIEFIIGTTHFYRGAVDPKNELIGVVYGCTIPDADAVNISSEHSEYRWVTADEAVALLTASDSSTLWIRRLIASAETIKNLISPALADHLRSSGFELG
jgi:8-oxo-dGTP pyrophosphatase MutT (NUDIX family)